MHDSRLILPIISGLILSGFTGCQRRVSHVPPAKPVKFEVYLAENFAAEGLVAVKDTVRGREVFRQATPYLTNSDVEAAFAGRDEKGNPAVCIRLDKAAARRNRFATSGHIQKPAVLVFGKTQMVIDIHEILSADVQITGNFTRTEAEQIGLGIMMF